MQLVLASFIDPTTYNQWSTLEALGESKPRIVWVCGFLLEQTEALTKIGLLVSMEAEGISDWVVIDSRVLVSLEVLKEVDLKGAKHEDN